MSDQLEVADLFQQLFPGSDFLAVDPRLDDFMSAIRKFHSLMSQAGRLSNGLIGTSHVVNSILHKDARLGDFCIVRNSVIGPGVVVGGHAQINWSVVHEGTELPHYNNVAYSIIGRDVLLGACTVTASRRLDETRPVLRLRDGRRIEAKEERVGALVGDGARIGSHVVVNPFTVVMPGVLVYPGQSVSGWLTETNAR